METIITQSEKETFKLGKKISSKLLGGEVVCFFGDLGAGKTTFIKGIGSGLGIKKPVTSPTFILMNVYRIRDKKIKIQNFVHIDCYRISSSSEIENIGATEYFNNTKSLVLIEWPERIANILPQKRIEITITMLSQDTRQVVIDKK